jgi:hypothetical protein
LNNGNVTASGTGFLDVDGCVSASPVGTLTEDVLVKFCVNQNNNCPSSPSNAGTDNPCFDCLGTQLPMLPLGLKATLKAGKVCVDWVQPLGEDLRRLELERYTNNLTTNTTLEFFDIKPVAYPKPFRFYDEAPGSGIVYYRIKWIRTDASYGYSNFISVKTSDTYMKIYPNPVSANQFNIRLPSEVGNVQVSLYNLIGEPIQSIEVKKEGTTIVVWFKHKPHAGLYIVSVFDGKKYIFQKFQVN